jgi:UDP-N-acetylmuramyl pentapeptide phosphotransferase/UDP-N-acetylglucosamine-1-phosphate transferase
MIAFLFFSWPPEKLILSHGGFQALGFVMGCFMLTCSTEFADAPMCIAVAYLITEMGIAFYNRYMCGDKADYFYMSTSYYKTSQDEQYTLGVLQGILKILAINVVLSMIQIAAADRIALPVFSVVLNLWLLSILSGDTNPEDVISLTKWGKKAIKSAFSKSKKAK